jgi:prepilin-type processing-associated H-X9-DG protein
LIVDSGYSLISWKALCPDSSSYKFEALSRQNIYYLPGAGVNQDRTIHPDHINDAIGGRHPKQILNVGYADGHVDNKKQEKLCPGFDEQGKPTNYSTWSTFKNR